MELIKISGTSYERGYKFGKKFKDEIKSCIKFEDKFWSVGVSLDQTKKSTKKNEKIFKSFAPEILEEIRGLADGSKLKYEELLNSSISSPYFSPMFCSAFVALNNLTKNRGPIMGRNVDWLKESKKYVRYVLTRPSNGYKHICSRPLESVGYYDGINERGLAIAWTGVFTLKSEVAPGMLMFFVTKLVLERCSSVKEAVKLIKNIPIASATNFIILDRNEAVVIETTSKHKVIRKPEKMNRGNFIIMTNNFISPKMKRYDIIQKKWPKITDPKIKRYKELIKESAGLIDIKMTKEILSDHEGFICIHGKEGEMISETISSFITLPRSKSLFYANGNPCENEYFNFRI